MRIAALNPAAAGGWPDAHLALLPERRAGALFPLGLAIVAELLGRRHEVTCIDENAGGRLDHPEAFGAIAVHAHGASLERIGRLRAATPRRVRIVAGGPLAALAPQLLAPHVDLLVAGEVEPQAEALLAALEASRPPERIGPPPRAAAFSAPAPALHPAASELVPYELARGCPCACAFCATPRIFPGGRAAKPEEQVAAELDAFAAAGERRPLFVVDDDAAADPAGFARFLRGLKRRGLSAIAKARAASLAGLDPTVPLEPLRQLNVVLRERPEDPEPGGEARRLLCSLARRRVRTEATLLAGHPGDDAARLDRFARFLEGVPLTKICLLPVSPLPGSAADPAGGFPAWNEERRLATALAPSRLTPDDWRGFVERVRRRLAADGLSLLKATLTGTDA